MTTISNTLTSDEQLQFLRLRGEDAGLPCNDQQSAPFDIESLLKRCLGNAAFAAELLKEFEATGPQRILELQATLSGMDFVAVANHAHSLKGVAGIMAADRLCEFAEQLEAKARVSHQTEIESWVNKTVQEIQRCLNEMPKL